MRASTVAARFPVTSLLKALGMDAEEILSTYYNTLALRRDGDGWRKPFDPETMKGTKPTHDLIDAKTGKVVHEGGKKLSARAGQASWPTDGLKAIWRSDEDLSGTTSPKTWST